MEDTDDKLVAHVCQLDRRDGAFEGPIESFSCEADSVPVTKTNGVLEIDWADEGVRLQIEDWESEDMLSGVALVAQWAELGKTPFTATRVPPLDIPQQ